ncbi:protein-disulfide reductase DsbD [Janthinobacterium psychrotolerans]|uniref:Thiol:disulfide interchange protein DsbD n=1 Tax=Janthinobacterium psychrotolerans TaxID=1747903 RepID=A0A1A7CAI4_9BURK|nr:protein-disulfide reductase DsbD [Janthinobacterium psychrotolerans]OBV41318.1 thiol:disulfide interchange protein DsbD [Janthinobacterium psychrotolerans]
MKSIFKCLCALLLAAWLPFAAAADFLPPEQAFVLKAELRDAHTVALRWTIPPGYHLYRERLSFTGPGVGQPQLPAGKRKFDENFGKEMETYYTSLALDVPVSGTAPFDLTLGYQGCADAGLCYPPVVLTYTVNPAAPGVLTAKTADDAGAPAAAVAATPATPAAAPAAAAAAHAEDDTSLAQRTLQSGSLWRIGGAFLVFGLLLSFTPCVLPMVPILSSIIVGEGGVTRRRGLLLAAAYSLGMALVYTALGVAAGLAGEGLAGALQKPWVLLTFGALLFALALSMFDVYQLQLPGSLQSRLSESSGRQSGGKLAGVFIMGALSALIVGPCVAGPLAGALLYISKTGNAATGGWALFAMAAGMSVPLLLTGLSAGSLLPRAGAWMNNVKKVFGLLLIAVAIWMIGPVLSVTASMALWGVFAILCATFLLAGAALPKGAGIGAYAARTLGVVMLLAGLFELVGAASSGTDVLQPLAHLRGGGAVAGATTGAHEGPRFTRIRTVAELDQVLASAGKPVMLDFYADWCVACKEMERMTFSDGRVATAMGGMRLLQVDVTANNADDRALMKRFELFGPPGIILFDASGKEVPQARVIGFMPPETFVRQLQRTAT